ncbi:ubiquitin family protein [Natronorubrum texcoconense]|uniref:C2H2-type domain-containing protein n=1 Tax=Natronorubrum texcoconense TaxID=1095776 RepID=A0A1G9C414_9EURY|nr:hypothetical protein [Natronorubrum texcoconense]SDK46429.1 hypothetical protein SAMN04515672_3206 [Natronorubrum texcoconense]
MPECDYCDASFSDETAYLEHLASDHEGQLGRIDRRRVEDHRGTGGDGDDESLGLAVYGFGAILGVIVLALVGYVVMMGVSDDGESRVHDHGQLTVEVDGETFDFEQQAYYYQELGGTFHFHPGDGNVWHMHPERVTLEEAMEDVTMPITDSSITIEGETYADEEPETSVDIAVDGQTVDLDYELQDGDHVQIVVETPDGDGIDAISDDGETDGDDEETDAGDSGDENANSDNGSDDD